MHVFESHIQWTAVKSVIETLKVNGFQALLAGGCVRDLLMKRVPNDFDVASDARPEQVEALFPKALTVGREFGVTILPFEGFQVEVATFRKDGAYVDGRRPESVVFSSPEEDAKRRDFTVNAIFYDLEHAKVIDYVAGQADIAAKMIRAVGEPRFRFEEDKLRVLRAVRFAAQLGFTIEANTLRAVKDFASKLKVVSEERIREELVKLFKAQDVVKGLELLRETGLLEAILPEVSAQLQDDETFRAVSGQLAKVRGEGSELGFLALTYKLVRADADVVMIRKMLKRLKCSNREIDSIVWALQSRDIYLSPEKYRRAILIRALANQYSEAAEAFFQKQGLAGEQTLKLWQGIHRDIFNSARQLPKPLISGDDLQRIGFAPGPKLGQILEEAFNLQLEGKFATQKEVLDWVASSNS